jgi:predicted permease
MRADLERSLILVPIIALAVHIILVCVAIAASRAMRLNRPSTGAMIVASAVGNTGFFGVPLIANSGPGFSPLAAVMFDTFATGLITWTSTVAVGSAYGLATDDRRVEWRQVGKALLLPPNWFLVAGLVLNLAGYREADLPEVILRPLQIASGAVLPLVMMYVGMMLAPRGISRVIPQVAAVVVMRLALAGLIGFALAWALGLRGDVLHTVVLMASMPTAIMSLVIGGGQYRLTSDIIAGSILATTVLCTVTLPIIRAIVA